jgi:hypothetical protein
MNESRVAAAAGANRVVADTIIVDVKEKKRMEYVSYHILKYSKEHPKNSPLLLLFLLGMASQTQRIMMARSIPGMAQQTNGHANHTTFPKSDKVQF